MRGRRGFTLLEIVLSIAALTMMSGFILRMFIASIELNRKAYNLDMGSNAAVMALETYSGGDIAAGDIMTRYYDSQWRLIEAGLTEADGGAEPETPDGAMFILTASASDEAVREFDIYAAFDSAGGYAAGKGQSGLYLITAAVYEITDENEQDEIVKLSTRKYMRTG